MYFIILGEGGTKVLSQVDNFKVSVRCTMFMKEKGIIKLIKLYYVTYTSSFETLGFHVPWEIPFPFKETSAMH